MAAFQRVTCTFSQTLAQSDSCGDAVETFTLCRGEAQDGFLKARALQKRTCGFLFSHLLM
jgi:hypothetical protein